MGQWSYDKMTKKSTVCIGVSRVHNSAVCLLKDGEILFHIENERLSNIKYDAYPFHALSKITQYVDHVDNICIAGVGPTVPAETFTDHDIYTTFITRLNKNIHNQKIEVYDLWNHHHKLHAACAFYNSGFSEALCIIKDGMGSEYPLQGKIFKDGSYGRESFSAFIGSYPAEFELVENHIVFPFRGEAQYNNTYVSDHLSEAMAFQITSQHFGFHVLDAGKVMGMAAYGKDDNNMPDILDSHGRINRDLFIIENHDLRQTRLNTEKYPYLNSDDFQIKANFARALQKSCEKIVVDDILRLLDRTKQKKLCISGGFFLNCVANYEILKRLPSDVEIYIEPISSDAGTAIGAAKLLHHRNTDDRTIRPQKSIYYGLDHDIDLNYITDKIKGSCRNLRNSLCRKTASIEVAELLSKKKIVAIFQGKSESGPRALGNRSILYDPRDPKGKDHVNLIKKREWFRPFAGTILDRFACDWFDLRSIQSSPFMMYAVDVVEDKKHLIPAVLHVDGTCRVQTLEKTTNPKYYELIENFYSITGVPILFNTSFNLAGDCIVETVDDAIETFNKSKIDYLYFPEIELLVEKNV